MRKAILNFPSELAEKKFPQHANKQATYQIWDNVSELTDHLRTRDWKTGDGDGSGDHYKAYKLDAKSDWLGNHTPQQALDYCSTGDLSSVPKSDKLLAKFENDITYMSSKFVTIDAISGGCPNVPAFLAGSPLSMRRRLRVASELAPLAIVVNLTSSASIDATTLYKRNVAILAMTRVLASKRPVSLYIESGMARYNDNSRMSFVNMVKLDTTPMDLARVAHVISSLTFTRFWLYALAINGHGCGMAGPWVWNDMTADRAAGQATARQALGVEPLYVGGAGRDDESLKSPEVWLHKMIEKYSKPDEP